MAQLTDDCFAFGGPLLPVAEALELLRARVPAVAEIETAPLAACLGRTLRRGQVAAMAVPPHDNSAVDGYALRFDDLNPDAETSLTLGGRAAAGHPLNRSIRKGEAIRIFTGAPMPKGADTVMMQEDCRLEGERVILQPGLKRGANRRLAGEDVAEASEILPAGRRLRPWDLGLAASVGLARLPVSRPLRVALLSTGDELREPGAAREEGQVFDANRATLAALLRAAGCQVTDLGILADRPEEIRGNLEETAKRHDAIVTSGGVSEGEEDHVKAALTAAGGSLHFWRLAIKPGRPVALGSLGGTAFVGLPGNPVACVVTFAALVRPLLLQMRGGLAEPLASFPVVTDFDHRKKRDRQEWLRVSLTRGAGDLPRARRFPREGAGILSSVAGSDGFLLLDEALTEAPAGSTLPFVPFSEVLA
ncbi:MAG: molybdopterin molybdotransferase MoeA [Rhodospirillales bacterium]